MNANELRIGNYVQPMFEHRNPCILGSIGKNGVGCQHSTPDDTTVRLGESFNYEDISPIPLSEEWLIGFGFSTDYKHFFRKQAEDMIVDLIEGPPNSGFNFHLILDQPSIKITTIFYVHQLQNLYFALTGEELTCNF